MSSKELSVFLATNYRFNAHLGCEADETKLPLEYPQELGNKNKFPHRAHSICRQST